LLTCAEDHFEHSARVLQDIVVPETHDFPAKAVQICGSARVDIIAVLSAVGFDDQAALHAGEVRDAAADRFLLLELESAEPTIAKMMPQAAFGIRRIASKRARMRIGSADRRHG
jgi:hypothetical protein